MKYNFDEVIDRRGTDSLKYDFAKQRGKVGDEISLWVADMDFRVADEITEALLKSVEHGIYGYTETGDAYFEAVSGWFETRFGWTPQRRHLVKTPGIVYAIAMAVKAYTKEEDAILIQQPVYYPFSEVVRDNNRCLINVPLVNHDGHYEIDFVAFEQAIVENKVKLFILCSPHNPVGRVWTKEELKALGDICIKHDVIIFSDEIHADFTYAGHTHTIFAALGEAYADISVVATAPSKTFNLAGLQVSNIFISNAKLRRAFRAEIAKSGYSQLNTLGLVAAKAAYLHGQGWLEELKTYLAGNLSYIKGFLKERLPQLTLIDPEGTYLVWIDFRRLGLTEEQREDLIVKRAKLWLDSGVMFGADGEGYERINIACPRAMLVQAMEQLEKAIKEM